MHVVRATFIVLVMSSKSLREQEFTGGSCINTTVKIEAREKQVTTVNIEASQAQRLLTLSPSGPDGKSGVLSQLDETVRTGASAGERRFHSSNPNKAYTFADFIRYAKRKKQGVDFAWRLWAESSVEAVGPSKKQARHDNGAAALPGNEPFDPYKLFDLSELEYNADGKRCLQTEARDIGNRLDEILAALHSESGVAARARSLSEALAKQPTYICKAREYTRSGSEKKMGWIYIRTGDGVPKCCHGTTWGRFCKIRHVVKNGEICFNPIRFFRNSEVIGRNWAGRHPEKCFGYGGTFDVGATYVHPQNLDGSAPTPGSLSVIVVLLCTAETCKKVKPYVLVGELNVVGVLIRHDDETQTLTADQRFMSNHPDVLAMKCGNVLPEFEVEPMSSDPSANECVLRANNVRCTDSESIGDGESDCTVTSYVYTDHSTASEAEDGVARVSAVEREVKQSSLQGIAAAGRVGSVQKLLGIQVGLLKVATNLQVTQVQLDRNLVRPGLGVPDANPRTAEQRHLLNSAYHDLMDLQGMVIKQISSSVTAESTTGQQSRSLGEVKGASLLTKRTQTDAERGDHEGRRDRRNTVGKRSSYKKRVLGAAGRTCVVNRDPAELPGEKLSQRCRSHSASHDTMLVLVIAAVKGWRIWRTSMEVRSTVRDTIEAYVRATKLQVSSGDISVTTSAGTPLKPSLALRLLRKNVDGVRVLKITLKVTNDQKQRRYGRSSLVRV